MTGRVTPKKQRGDCPVLNGPCPPHPDTGRRCKPGICDLERLAKTAAKSATPDSTPTRVTIAIEIPEDT